MGVTDGCVGSQRDESRRKFENWEEGADVEGEKGGHVGEKSRLCGKIKHK